MRQLQGHSGDEQSSVAETDVTIQPNEYDNRHEQHLDTIVITSDEDEDDYEAYPQTMCPPEPLTYDIQ